MDSKKLRTLPPWKDNHLLGNALVATGVQWPIVAVNWRSASAAQLKGTFLINRDEVKDFIDNALNLDADLSGVILLTGGRAKIHPKVDFPFFVHYLRVKVRDNVTLPFRESEATAYCFVSNATLASSQPETSCTLGTTGAVVVDGTALAMLPQR